MGVKKLSRYILDNRLAKIYPSIYEFTNSNKINKNMYILAIDVWLFAHKFQYSTGNIINGFLNLIIKLLLNNILPIPIFDGKPPNEKKEIILQRERKKNKKKEQINILKEKLKELNINEEKEIINLEIKKLNKQIIYISKDDIFNLQKLLDILNIPYINAKGEADCMCAKLYKEKKIDGCLSDDMDILAHGCYKLIKITGKKVIEFNLYTILEKLNLNHQQFIDMCILFGCDYTRPSKIKPDMCYKLISEYKNLENIVLNNLIDDKNNKFIDNYKKAQQIFNTASDNELVPNMKFTITRIINIDNFINFIDTCNIINDKKKIINNINTINYKIEKNIFSNQNNENIYFIKKPKNVNNNEFNKKNLKEIDYSDDFLLNTSSIDTESENI